MHITDKRNLSLATGQAVGNAEATALGLMTSRVYRLRQRHPKLYALIAFVLGSVLVGGFAVSTYGNWAYEGVDLSLAFAQVVCGATGGGIVMVVLAFAYTRTLRPVLEPMVEHRVISSRP